MSQKSIAVTYLSPEQQPKAEALAAKLGLGIVSEPNTPHSYHYLLVCTPDYLGLINCTEKRPKPFYIDFLGGKMAYRSQQASLRKELIAKAMGIKPSLQPVIVDATAGLGRDSFILATLGYKVTSLERSPILFELLRDAVQRGVENATTSGIMQNITLICQDSCDYLEQNIQPDIIYLDPMFPERQKAASVKKEMVILQDLLGKDEDSTKLFETALTCAKKRIVVKRPRLAATITPKIPDYSLTGKSSRFDIYLKRVNL